VTTSAHDQLPEVIEFERLLRKPNSDATGFAGFFNSGVITFNRVPARLDIMGGIADYSGANVCEGVLGSGIAIALQPRTDRTLRIRTVQVGQRSLPVETRLPLDYLEAGDVLGSYLQVRELCKANPLSAWAAYIGGSIFTMLKEEGVQLPFGFSLLLLSNIPMNVGIGSSAATEIAVLRCLQAHLDLKISESRLAQLGQLAENQVVGAPCGIMDQIAVTSGRAGCLTHILCRPGSVEGTVKVPAGTAFVGINSMVKHSVGGSAYGDVRIGAFMGKKIINTRRAALAQAPVTYLTELAAAEFEREYAPHLPERVLGSEFLDEYKTHDDPVTTVQPDAEYRLRGPASHPIHENERVLRFMKALRAANEGDGAALITAGEQMYAAHESYKTNCRLSVEEVDFLVEAVRKRGPERGLYGAKITGGGSGGVVAVFGTAAGIATEVPAMAQEYKRRVGALPDVFEGTSPGAAEFGTFRYEFGSMGWKRA
jgi:galactokinase